MANQSCRIDVLTLSGLLSPEVHEAENFLGLQREEFLFPDLFTIQDRREGLSGGLDMEHPTPSGLPGSAFSLGAHWIRYIRRSPQVSRGVLVDVVFVNKDLSWWCMFVEPLFPGRRSAAQVLA